MRWVGVLLLLGVSGCGGSASNEGQPSPLPARNDAVIEQAKTAPDAVAEAGASAIRARLQRELRMNNDGTFRLHPDQPTECQHEVAEESRETGLELECIGDASDCYVKTGAEATAFESERRHILYSPDGADLVFVQTY